MTKGVVRSSRCNHSLTDISSQQQKKKTIMTQPHRSIFLNKASKPVPTNFFFKETSTICTLQHKSSSQMASNLQYNCCYLFDIELHEFANAQLGTTRNLLTLEINRRVKVTDSPEAWLWSDSGHKSYSGFAWGSRWRFVDSTFLWHPFPGVRKGSIRG